MFSLWATPTLAADQITLSFEGLAVNVQVSDLSTFAQTGQLSSNLAAYAQLAPKEYLTDFRSLLQESFEISPTTVSQFSKSQTGTIIFQALGELLKTQDNQNGQTALVTAFVQAAANPKGFTVLDVIRQFPSPTMQIDGQLSFKAVSTINQKLRNRGLILNEIQQLAKSSLSSLPPSLLDLTKPGPNQWTKQTLNVDGKALGIVEPVPVDYYFPRGLSAPAPVIVIAYGFASNRATFAYLAEHLASYGFVVVVPTFPGTDTQWVTGFLAAKGPSDVNIAAALLGRPRGITLLLDDLQQKVQSNPLFKQVDPQQVGLIGQSLGGYTVLASAGAPINFPEIQQQCSQSNFEKLILTFNLSLVFECQLYNAPKTINNVPVTNGNLGDPRVKAVIAINPLTSIIFGQLGMSQIKVPTMLISGSDDIFAPPIPGQISPFTWLTTTDKYLFILKGGTHFSFLGGDDSQGGLPVPADLIGPDPQLARPSLKAVSIAFFHSHLANQQQYLPYLNQTYVQTLVPQPFGVNFIKSLTADQLQQAVSNSSN
jgi:predicted dienelactone hydrolase